MALTSGSQLATTTMHTLTTLATSQGTITSATQLASTASSKLATTTTPQIISTTSSPGMFITTLLNLTNNFYIFHNEISQTSLNQSIDHSIAQPPRQT